MVLICSICQGRATVLANRQFAPWPWWPYCNAHIPDVANVLLIKDLCTEQPVEHKLGEPW